MRAFSFIVFDCRNPVRIFRRTQYTVVAVDFYWGSEDRNNKNTMVRNENTMYYIIDMLVITTI